MGDRFFVNELAEFITESQQSCKNTTNEDSLKQAAILLKQTAILLKQTVVNETWGRSGRKVHDYTLYTGALGTAYVFFKSYLITKNKDDLNLSSEIVRACESVSNDSGRVTFICGQAGVYALGAVLAKHSGDERLYDDYVTKFKLIKLPKDLPDELLYGRAGFLWACSFLNKNIGKDTISRIHMRHVVKEIIKSGRRLANKGRSPLMYEWYGKKYWGVAHGLAGIMHILMDMELKPDEVADVKGTLRYMIKNRLPSGNYLSSEGSETDRLVHWCHGASGVALTLVKAAEVFGDEEFVKAAVDAGELVWSRGLLKRVGICHGISGNTYIFLSLYRLTGKAEYLYRAKAFTSFLLDKSQKLISEGTMHDGDLPYSLFEGIGGMAYLFMDMTQPSEAKFPAYEL